MVLFPRFAAVQVPVGQVGRTGYRGTCRGREFNPPGGDIEAGIHSPRPPLDRLTSNRGMHPHTAWGKAPRV